MKATILTLLLLILIGCATIPKCPPCPSGGPMEMPKGFFDQEEGKYWMHTGDYNRAVEKRGGL